MNRTETINTHTRTKSVSCSPVHTYTYIEPLHSSLPRCVFRSHVGCGKYSIKLTFLTYGVCICVHSFCVFICVAVCVCVEAEWWCRSERWIRLIFDLIKICGGRALLTAPLINMSSSLWREVQGSKVKVDFIISSQEYDQASLPVWCLEFLCRLHYCACAAVKHNKSKRYMSYTKFHCAFAAVIWSWSVY